MNIILASRSPNRKKLLLKAGLDFKVFDSKIEEERFLNPKRPARTCGHLAKLKALKAQESHPESLIIACDQMAFLKGRLFGKALTERQAIDNLVQLQGKTHKLFTALYMLWGRKSFSHVSKSLLTMRRLSVPQIKQYILKDQPLKAAGSYHVESLGVCLFEKIKTEDFNSIEGLPLIQVLNQLVKWGLPLLSESTTLKSHKD